MTKIQSDDILDGLYKLRKRESEKLKTVLELYDLEFHQNKAGPYYHRLKTMVKSIAQDLRNRNLGARKGNYERNAVVKNQGTNNNSFCETWHHPEFLFYKTKSGCRLVKSTHMRIVRLMNRPSKKV